MLVLSSSQFDQLRTNQSEGLTLEGNMISDIIHSGMAFAVPEFGRS
jgi:hypothetical protein